MRRIFGIIVLTITFSLTAFSQSDSLGIEKEGDKIYVIHKVKAKQTLISLARRYQTTITEIKTANDLSSNGLQVDQMLKIPFGGTLPTANVKPVQLETVEVEHEVAAGETLFAISKKYGVSITDLKTWNQLSSNALSLGQSLKVKVEKPVEKAKEAATNQKPKTVSTPTPVAKPNTPDIQIATDTTSVKETVEPDPVPEPVTYDGRNFESYELEGMAEVIDEEEPSTKYFALHKTARPGTVVKVKNLMNGLVVYVRVVGTIPDTTVNDDIIIKLNLKAYTQLKAIDKRFRVQISYHQ
ncbi:LysM peptidoglycan-binding domain-containing protein [Roseivirga misakiensis]|uniref:LysM domain-containing protein n=1 Tax=Roseivirga misakiensis TaxID=1563681 RepID=A0A1E5SKK1_9BACT|nr:LysM peptidoglycan-binding domain-containing protein [Roseivirga misakiensis]OEJ99664.1 hypothetical protein BFP71_08830 [Roseivirga misakiensis]